jgi:short-subunit dehydrogenase
MSKTAVITGATTGIGAAYARRLAKDGYNLVITGRRKEIIQKLTDDIVKQYGIKIDLVIAELSDDNDFQKLVDVIKTKEDIEFLINNAGYSGYDKYFDESDVADHEKMIKVHQIIPMRLISLVLPGMIKRHSGNIINVSSMAAFTPFSCCSVYCSTKAFLKTYTESLYFELKDKGIKVQALCPGWTQTDFGKSHYSKEIYAKMIKQAAMSPERVVDYSLNCLKKNKVVSIPGFTNKMVVKLFPSLPRGMYYWVGTRMTPYK